MRETNHAWPRPWWVGGRRLQRAVASKRWTLSSTTGCRAASCHATVASVASSLSSGRPRRASHARSKWQATETADGRRDPRGSAPAKAATARAARTSGSTAQTVARHQMAGALLELRADRAAYVHVLGARNVQCFIVSAGPQPTDRSVQCTTTLRGYIKIPRAPRA